jgi:hypothetical protein
MHGKEFRIIWEFLAKYGIEVEGHASAHLSPEQEIALSRLASGNIDELARGKLEPLLATNGNAIAFLAEQFKARRPNRGDAVGQSK